MSPTNPSAIASSSLLGDGETYWTEAVSKPMKHFGPMYGERSRRHQRVIQGRHHCVPTKVIWTQVEADGHLHIEVQPLDSSPVVLKPTLEQAVEMRDALNDYIDTRA